MTEDSLDKLMGIEPLNGDEEVVQVKPRPESSDPTPVPAAKNIGQLLTMEALQDPANVQQLAELYTSLKDEESRIRSERKKISDYLNAAADRIGCEAFSGTTLYFDCSLTHKTDWDVDKMALEGAPCIVMVPKIDTDAMKNLHPKDLDHLKAEYATSNVPVRHMVEVVKIKTGKATV